jgi:hypothetical protein
VLQLLVTANILLNWGNLPALMLEAIRSSETSVIIKATRSHISENGLLHSHHRENLKSYICQNCLQRNVDNVEVIFRTSTEHGRIGTLGTEACLLIS